MESGNFPEHRIRTKIGLIFLVIILYVAGIFFYSFDLKKGIDAQQAAVAHAHELLSQNDRLIVSVHQAQNILNAYLITPHKNLRQKYDSLSADISRQIIALRQLGAQNRQDLFTQDIDSLLREKNIIVDQLIAQFRLQNPIQEINKKIENYDEFIRDSIALTTHTDTVVIAHENKNFWKRLRNLFDPQDTPDSTVHISTIEREVRLTSPIDTGVYADLKNATRAASKNYSSQISGIEKHLQELIIAEQNISLQISQRLTRFHHETSRMVWSGIANGEALTRKVFVFAVVVGAFSLIVILIISAFIIGDLKAGREARSDLVKEKQLTESLLSSRHKLLLSVSHDIKTPLSSMMGYLEMWEAENPPENKKKQLQSAQNSGKHILNMLSNLLEFSRLEQNTSRMLRTRFDLTELMEEMEHMFRPIAHSKKLEIAFENHTSAPFFVETDYTALKQILTNLISNAAKYTLQGGIRIRWKHQDGLLFSVTDTGVGIDPNVMEEIFKPFTRIDNRIKSEGSGLGMYVTKGLVNSLQGTIHIQSEKGKGTCVTVKIPVHKTDNPNIPIPKNTTSTGEKSYEKILIFEDDPALGNMIREFLVRNQYRVKLCTDPSDVKGFVNHINLFDLVFTDMQMTHTTGLDILRQIRKVNHNIPVWLMTAHGDYTTDRAMAEGFNGLIKKPIKMSSMLEILSEGSTTRSEELSEEMPFTRLETMFGNDTESIRSVLSSFIANARQDIKTLNTLIDTSRFEAAQELCHKIHPFLSQLNAGYLCGTLRKMDQLRGQPQSAYPTWKEELSASTQDIAAFIDRVEQKYG